MEFIRNVLHFPDRELAQDNTYKRGEGRATRGQHPGEGGERQSHLLTCWTREQHYQSIPQASTAVCSHDDHQGEEIQGFL